MLITPAAWLDEPPRPALDKLSSTSGLSTFHRFGQLDLKQRIQGVALRDAIEADLGHIAVELIRDQPLGHRAPGVWLTPI